MPFSEDDEALIKKLYLIEGYDSPGLLTEFSMKNWMNDRLIHCGRNWRKTDALTESVVAADSMFAPELANNWNMTISEGSAAMPLRCGGICNDNFVANFVLNLAVK